MFDKDVFIMIRIRQFKAANRPASKRNIILVACNLILVTGAVCAAIIYSQIIMEQGIEFSEKSGRIASVLKKSTDKEEEIIMKKKLLALTAVVALAGVVMVGCGSSKKETEAATEAATTAVTEATEAASEAETTVDTEEATEAASEEATTEAASEAATTEAAE